MGNGKVNISINSDGKTDIIKVYFLEQSFILITYQFHPLKNMQKQSHSHLKPQRSWCLVTALVAVLLFISLFLKTSNNWILCNNNKAPTMDNFLVDKLNSQQILLDAILHYATSRVIPQQNINEIRISFDVLKNRTPCNFLVFGLGHDSQMWASFNSRGNTLFLEEDPKWVETIVKDAPFLHAETVKYRTMLSEADDLVEHYRKEPDCSAKKSFLRGNHECKLALDMLSNEVYDKEWDLIMIDAPRGYFAEAPGRMAAIYSAAVMARNRKGKGVTHVFLHDVERKVEKVYAELFLCRKYLVKGVGRLWHFEIPPASNVGDSFC